MGDDSLKAIAASLQLLTDLHMQEQTKSGTSQVSTGKASTVFQAQNGLFMFDPFDESKEIFSTYKSRLENYFDLGGIKDDKKACTKLLLHCIGSVHFETLASHRAPEPPTKFEYDKLINLLKDHVMPAPNVIVEQHRFLKRSQKSDENIMFYVSESFESSFLPVNSSVRIVMNRSPIFFFVLSLFVASETTPFVRNFSRKVILIFPPSFKRLLALKHRSLTVQKCQNRQLQEAVLM